MSFFGFDPTQARDHNARAPGFGAAPDPFAGLGQRGNEDEGEM
jgi:DNA topoisomerase 2-associated protein PAT1